MGVVKAVGGVMNLVESDGGWTAESLGNLVDSMSYREIDIRPVGAAG